MTDIAAMERDALRAVSDRFTSAAVFIRCGCGAVFIGTREMEQPAKDFILYHRMCQVNTRKEIGGR